MKKVENNMKSMALFDNTFFFSLLFSLFKTKTLTNNTKALNTQKLLLTFVTLYQTKNKSEKALTKLSIAVLPRRKKKKKGVDMHAGD
jgi:hypothetical protein